MIRNIFKFNNCMLVISCFMWFFLIIMLSVSSLAWADDNCFSQAENEPSDIVYTTLSEPAYLPSNLDGWQETIRGVQYYSNGSPITGWLINSNYKNYGLQRYFFGADSYLVKSRAITDEEAGYWAYARPEGFVVRGAYDNGAAKEFLADNDGRLPDDTGWLVTDKYTPGSLQRYYICEEDHSAKTAFFNVDNNRYWGEGGVGYVLRSCGERAGLKISANNDGQLLKEGWLCTADFGQGFQRYWFKDFSVPAKGTYNTGGINWTYVTKLGFVLRGVYDNGSFFVFLANNDGLLASQEGWLVTGEYTGGILQRYYIDGDVHAAKSAFFDVDGNRYWGEAGVGYVLRSCGERAGLKISANNDGKLLKEGWLYTADYGQGFQRYWFINYSIPAEGYYIVGNNLNANIYTYVTSAGYVLRATYDNVNRHVFLADNDVVLASMPGWLVTNKYTGGSLERYYIDSTIPAAKTSSFTVDGKNYFGRGGVGYVVRNANICIDNNRYYANNDGVLTKIDVQFPLYHGIKHGIDVSEHQGAINWSAVASSETVGFAMIRAGYYYNYPDAWFVQNYNNAHAAGIPVGAYWFSYARSVDDARQEAQGCLNVLNGRFLDYPVAFDLEWYPDLDVATNTAMINAFCEIIAAAGYTPMVYASESWFNSKFNVYDLHRNIFFWVAQWTKFPGIARQEMMKIWQTSSSGSVLGIAGRVDEDQIIYLP